MASSEKEDKKVDSEEKLSDKEKTEKVEEKKEDTEKKPTYPKKNKGKKFDKFGNQVSTISIVKG